MPAPSTSPPRILVVEDEPAVCELLTQLLGGEGYETVCALGDRTAYERLDTEDASIAALVVDINLGSGTTGYDVARYARRRRPKLPVIYITGASAKSLEKHGVSGGVLVTKPFDGELLLTTLTEKLAGR